MLKEIVLSKFGRFADARFKLEGTTVFYGPNEAGKTTIFDAIFHALCRPSGTRRSGKLLRERYGAEADSHLEFTGDSVRIDDEEFRNLHAIRAGDVAASLPAGDSRWIEKVRATLFAGGLDPRELSERLRARTQTHAGRVHNKEKKALEAERHRLQARLDELRAKRSRILAGDARLAGLRRRLTETAERLGKTRAFLKEQEEERTEQEAARERLAVEALLGDLEILQELNERLERLEALPRGDVRQFDGLARDRDKVKTELTETEGRIESRRVRLEAAADQETARAAESAVQKRKRDEATLALDRLREFRDRSAFRTEIRWNPVLLGLAAAAFVGAGVGLFFTQSYSPYYTLPVAGVVVLLGGMALLFARRSFSVPDQAALQDFTQRLRAEWESHFPDESGWPGESPQSAETYLASWEPAYRAHLQESERQRTELTELRAHQEADNHERVRLEIEHSRAQATCAAYLKQHEVATRDELLLRSTEINELTARRDGLLARIERRNPDTDPERLRRESRRKLEQFDEAGVPRLVAPEDKLRALRARCEETRRKIAGLEGEERAALLESERLASEMRGSTQGLPEEIVELETELAAKTARLGELELDGQAARVGAELFEDLAQDTELALRELTRELAELYGDMAADGGNLQLETLEFKNVLLQDRGGELRALEHCSTGTRDLFLLAARLVLARRTAPAVRLLVLDEPFLSLDAGRRRGVLEFLAAFQVAHDWQFIFFTKEPELLNEIRAIFQETAVHEPLTGQQVESSTRPKRSGAKRSKKSDELTAAPGQVGLFADR